MPAARSTTNSTIAKNSAALRSQSHRFISSGYESLASIAPFASDVRSRRWLVTGAAGFIGSHLVEALLALGATVRGMDNLSAGMRENLELIGASVGEDARKRFEFHETDIRSAKACREACEGVDVVLHQAALGSVPLSLDAPALANEVNVGGFVNIPQAARAARVKRVVYSSSCAIYDESPELPKKESIKPAPINPYALTKLINEQYSDMFSLCFSLESIGLRYFNIYGPRQDPRGAYAAVIPLWLTSLLEGRPIKINVDGENTRDFCHVSDVVQANLRAALSTAPTALAKACNIASEKSVSLNQLLAALAETLGISIEREEARAGNIRYFSADISLARWILGFSPTRDIQNGLAQTAASYRAAGKNPRPADGP